MEYITISKASLSWKKTLLLRRFERTIFKDSFPDDNERESFSDIIPRIRHNDSATHPYSYCVLAMDGRSIAGGVVADWYPSCKSLEIIYIAVDPDKRGQGVGKHLLKNEALPRIMAAIREEEKSEVKNIFLEVEIPIREPMGMEINPVDRVVIWDKWGAKRIPIHYTQPPLSPGKAPASNLMLMALPVGNIPSDRIKSEDLVSFLKDFYKGLGASDSIFLTSMIQEIEEIEEKETDTGLSYVEFAPLFEDEKIDVEFQNAVLTSHFEFNPKKMDIPEVCFNFNSFECDLMRYAYQIERPFRTILIGVYKRVTLHMPSNYCYTSEGNTYYRRSVNKTLTADISLSVTFPTTYGRAIAHMSIKPSAGTVFSNLDMIKLIEPHGSCQENYIASSKLTFSLNRSTPLTDTEFMQKMIGGSDYVRIPEGVSQIDFDDLDKLTETEDDFFSRFITDKKGKPEDKVTESLQNNLLCGLILGIFDYERMNAAEIIDTVRPIVVKKDSFMVLCRGHLMKIEKECDLSSKIFIDPYTLIPSAVLAIDGVVLKQSEEMVDNNFKHALNPLSSKARRAEVLLNNEYLENIFQYPSEQEIIQTGFTQRNMTKRFENLIERIDILKHRERSSADIFVEFVLCALAVFESIGILNSVIAGNVRIPVTAISLFSVIFIIETVKWIKTRVG